MAIVLGEDGHYVMTDIEKKAILEQMEREYQDDLKTTKNIRNRWWLTERYLEGNQWSSAGEAGWTFLSVANNAGLNNNAMEVNVDENVVSDNIMLRVHMTNVARLCRYKPQIEIAPNQKTKERAAKAQIKNINLDDIEDPAARKAIQQLFNYLGLETQK